MSTHGGSVTIVKVSIGTFLLGCSIAAAQVPEAQRVRIHDPERLERLGVGGSATDVWERVERGSRHERRESPDSWGGQAGYSSLLGYELHEEYHRGNFYKTVPDATCPVNSPSGPFNARTDAYFDVPDGVELLEFRLWASDTDDQWLTVDLWETCQNVGFDPPVTTLLKTAETIGFSGQNYLFAPLDGLTANSACAYSVRVWFTSDELAPCTGGNLRFQKAQLVWRRQVSPPPATATFADVPPDHPFFQYVEALSKSGITGGCGNGNFCPSSPLTRGQMAVFLSKALGLQWP
jgi:hypothetical protein